MNIAIVNATVKWGGVKTWQLDFAEGLAARGHQIRVFGRQQEFVQAARQRTGHGEKVSFGADCNPVAVYRFYKRFRDNDIDIVMINVGKDLATAGVAARMAGIPVVQFIGLPEDIPHRWKTRLLHSFVDPYFLSSCRFIQEGFIQSLPYIKKDKTHMILTAKHLGPEPRHANQPRVLVATQQLNADKDHETLLRALASIGAPYELHVAGTGQHEAYLHNLAESLGIAKNITWHGFVTDIPALLAKADIFLLASLTEGLPNTLQEALGAGLLPVLRDVGGVREILSNPLLPWLLPYEADAKDFARVLEKALLLPDDELIALRRHAQDACRTFCNLEDKLIEMETWLTQILEQHKEAGA